MIKYFNRPKAFFFHYNKPASLTAKDSRVSIHIDNTCHIVSNIVCGVPCYGRKKKTQPRFVMCGKATMLQIVEDEGNLVAILG